VAEIIALLMMKIAPRTDVHPRVSTWHSVVEGFSFAWHTRPVRALLMLLGLVSVMGMPYTVLMPIIADRTLHGGAHAYGVLMSASGSGALAGAAMLTMRRHIRGLGRWIAVTSIGFGASLIAFSFSRVLWLSVVLLVPAGFCMMVEMAASNTLIQSMVPDRLRGRVMAVYSMMFMGMAPVGALFAGAIAAPVGAPQTVAIGGAVCIAGGLMFGANLPRLRDRGRELIVAQQVSPGLPADDAAPVADEA
jgi:MFS family permease